MKTIHVPAAKIRQGKMMLYAASIAVRHLVTPGFFSIERLDPANPDPATPDAKFQRLLDETRAKKFSDFIIGGQKAEDVLLPTSIFLATESHLDYDDEAHMLALSLPMTSPLSVVDGQHRLHGLKMAAASDKLDDEVREKILNFEVSVNIAAGLPNIVQMCHFLLVNSTQRSVDKGVEQRIIARLTEMQKTEAIPRLPRWIEKKVGHGDVNRAIKLIEYLNETPGSPWYGKIELANTKVKGAVKEKTFNTSIVNYVLKFPQNPLADEEISQAQKIFLNYWRALANILDDGQESVLYKTYGVYLFCLFSTPFLMRVDSLKVPFSVEIMEKMMRECFDNMDQYETLGTPVFWHSGGPASGFNFATIREAYSVMSRALGRGPRQV